MKIGQKLRTLRENAGLERKEAAKELGVATPTLAHWENNDNEPSFSHLEKISKLYKISISEIFGEDCIKPLPEETKNNMLDKVLDIMEDEGLLLDANSYDELDEHSQVIIKSVINQLITKKKKQNS